MAAFTLIILSLFFVPFYIRAKMTIILAIIWSIQLDHFKSIFQGISALISYIAPPITTVFLWGVFWKRASGFAAAITLALGSLLGLTVFFLDNR
jgi:SSS family solute:Na+ symporter